jgi:hypothetical protein
MVLKVQGGRTDQSTGRDLKRCQEQFSGQCIPGTAFSRPRKRFLTPFISPYGRGLLIEER